MPYEAAVGMLSHLAATRLPRETRQDWATLGGRLTAVEAAAPPPAPLLHDSSLPAARRRQRVDEAGGGACAVDTAMGGNGVGVEAGAADAASAEDAAPEAVAVVAHELADMSAW